jgi:hypothetical protein
LLRLRCEKSDENACRTLTGNLAEELGLRDVSRQPKNSSLIIHPGQGTIKLFIAQPGLRQVHNLSKARAPESGI